MSFTIPNRPFATEPFTGLMLPDGIFEASIGKQTINAHIKNTGAAVSNIQVYVESISDPGIIVSPATIPIANAEGGVSYLFNWEADFSAAAPGKHLISFIIETPSGDVRIIKKIFVTKLGYNPGDGSFSAITPEGIISLEINKVVRPKDKKCCRRPKHDPCGCRPQVKNKELNSLKGTLLQHRDKNSRVKNVNVLEYLIKGFQGHDPNFEFCLPGYLLKDIKVTVTPTPPYSDQYGDLPFQDPWWKILLCILAVLLLIAAAIAEAVGGDGEVTVSGGSGGGGGSDEEDCCGVEASGGGSSYVAAGLVAAAAAVATAAGASDIRDPFRKGADNTPPGPGEITLKEELNFIYKYIEPIELGKPFKVGAEWKYTRHTNVTTYTYNTSEVNENIHTISKYEIKAPDILKVYKREEFIIEAMFYDQNNKLLKGDQLFVQCFLIGPNGQFDKIILQDNGVAFNADKKANDGIYTGRRFFSTNDKGIWTYFVIAQDINHATPDMKPEEAAQIIGGMVLTHQLIITFNGGTCDLIPDGHVNVITP
ncbi:MAG: hypothetical protein E6K54_01460 [Gammaproteobacteria bacterium]|nr:MAG: hypothetical protein E6K54_01460 [Gammaproteobacteria bacterium]